VALGVVALNSQGIFKCICVHYLKRGWRARRCVIVAGDMNILGDSIISIIDSAFGRCLVLVLQPNNFWPIDIIL
jgi:hypothetical protein